MWCGAGASKCRKTYGFVRFWNSANFLRNDFSEKHQVLSGWGLRLPLPAAAIHGMTGAA
jgi:hypothetical protein